MKKLNRKGFTLIELLAVITIMSILMLVAIPAVARTIENTRRDTFANTALEYISAIEQAVLTDAIECENGEEGKYEAISALPNRTEGYTYFFDSNDDTGKDLMEQGGKSSWGNAHVKGVVTIVKKIDNDKNKTTYEYKIRMVDTSNRGIGTDIERSSVKRSAVKTSGQTAVTKPAAGHGCQLVQ